MKLFKKILSTALSFVMIFSSTLSLRVFAGKDDETSAISTSEIPTNLEECCLKLDEILSQEVKDEIKICSDRDLVKFHLGFGMWIRNNWIYPCSKGRISELLYNNGCDSADEKFGIILENYRNYLLTGESTTNIEDLVIDHWFNFWHMFNNNLKREEIKETIEKRINVRASRRQNTWSIISKCNII